MEILGKRPIFSSVNSKIIQQIIPGAIFICLKLTYGDRQAAHRFTRAHEILIRCFVLPLAKISRNQIELVVDDVAVVAPGFDVIDKLRDFDEKYTSTMERLGKGKQYLFFLLSYLSIISGFTVKPADPSGFKAFRQIQRGEVLGFLIDTNTHQWSLSKEKLTKIVEAVDSCYYTSNLYTERPIKTKTAQKALGKLQVSTT